MRKGKRKRLVRWWERLLVVGAVFLPFAWGATYFTGGRLFWMAFVSGFAASIAVSILERMRRRRNAALNPLVDVFE